MNQFRLLEISISFGILDLILGVKLRFETLLHCSGIATSQYV